MSSTEILGRFHPKKIQKRIRTPTNEKIDSQKQIKSRKFSTKYKLRESTGENHEKSAAVSYALRTRNEVESLSDGGGWHAGDG